MVTILSDKPSIANHFIKELRSSVIQLDRMRFRNNLRRLGEIFAYEISKTLNYKSEVIETPLGEAPTLISEDRIVLAAILRAGLPMHQGFLNFFDRADNAFISAYRAHEPDGSFDIRLQYMTCPNIDDATVIIIDPMLATGASMDKTIQYLLDTGAPRKLHAAIAIGSRGGMSHIQRLYPEVELWFADLDDELTAKSLIVPGLGDAGDLSYGEKIQN